jgi:uncharacterized protein (DUF1778 family)
MTVSVNGTISKSPRSPAVSRSLDDALAWCQSGTMAAGEANVRLVARIPPGMRKTIQAAADLQGAKLNQFVVQAAYQQAKDVLERETILRLNREQAQRVFALLDRPPRPNAKLRAAKELHRKLVRA